MSAHGTPARYKHGPDENDVAGKGCRCGACREACRVDVARRRCQPPATVTAEPARRALAKLRRYGWTLPAIADAIGDRHPENLLRGSRCLRTTSDAILSLLVDVESWRAEDRRRFPADPLLAEVAARGYQTLREQAVFLGVDPSQMFRWRRDGLRLPVADRLACRLGRHPSYFWPDYFARMEAA